jgi:hypothetical protein
MKKTFSVLLSLIILLSSLNFSLSAHYCGQTIVDVALFGQAEACPMADEMNNDSEEPCCSDRQIIIEGEDYLSSKSFEKQEVEKIDILLSEFQFPLELLLEEENTPSFIANYTPPLIEQDITLAVQSFLL